MKMIIIAELKELPLDAKRVGSVKCLCNGCGKRMEHYLFETEEKIFICCPICKLKWEVAFHDAKGTA